MDAISVCGFCVVVVIGRPIGFDEDRWIMQVIQSAHNGHFPHDCTVASRPYRLKPKKEVNLALQVLESHGGSGPAASLYYYRTGDILDYKILHRLQSLKAKAEMGESGVESASDRLIWDLEEKAKAGELEYMLVFADAMDCVKRVGDTYTVSTTYVHPGGPLGLQKVHGHETLGTPRHTCLLYCRIIPYILHVYTTAELYRMY
jgi:hypothetical protein